MASSVAAWRNWLRSAPVPESVARRATTVSRRVTGAAAPQGSRLVFRDPPPQAVVQKRDPQGAMNFIQVAQEAGAEQAEKHGWNRDDPLAEQIRSVAWYHTIELPGGVVTPGQFDHRELLSRYGLPPSLAGKRALDVATFDGYWAFEMEKRGANVTAIDLDNAKQLDFPSQSRPLVDAVGELPTIGTGFRIASAALDSKVDRVTSSVYELDPEKHGTFDFSHCGDLLLHLRDPLTALERIRSVTTGTFLLCDVVDPTPNGGSLGPVTHYRGGWNDVTWWVPSLDALAQMIIDAGFSDVRVNCLYQLSKTYEENSYWRASLTATV